MTLSLSATFEQFARAFPGTPADERCRLFGFLSPKQQADCWARLAEVEAIRRWQDGELPFPDACEPVRLNEKPQQVRRSPERSDDVLATIQPPVYFEALTGTLVPVSGWVRCTLPDHEDRHPSCHVYPDPNRGWWCFGCGRGGSAIDLAAHLTGIEPKGAGYFELRRWIARRLLGMEGA